MPVLESEKPHSFRGILMALADTSATQRAMLHTLGKLTVPATIAKVAEVTGLHPNSVRECLDSLVLTGLVVRKPEPAKGRGRPAWIYETVSPDDVITYHQHVADLVLSVFQLFLQNSQAPMKRAEELGQLWGRKFLENAQIPDHSIFPKLDREVQMFIHVTKVRLFLSSQGFMAVSTDDPYRIELQSCPFVTDDPEAQELMRIVHEAMVREVVAALSRGRVNVYFLPAPPGSFATVKLEFIGD